MSAQKSTAIDWEKYNADVIQYYVEQNKTAEATIKFLREKYGLQVTVNQFKKQFSKSKNISVELWTNHIIPTIKKRARENKDSDVFMDGRPVGAKRVMTAMGRYSAQVDLDTVATKPPTGVERIRIATPQPPSPPPAPLPSPTQPVLLEPPSTGDNLKVVSERSLHHLEFTETTQTPISSPSLFTGVQTLQVLPEYDDTMPTNWLHDTFDECLDMQHTWNLVAQSPPPIAGSFPSPSILFQQGDVMAGTHVRDIFIRGLSPISPEGFGERDLARWTRVNLVVDLPWLQFIDLIDPSKLLPRFNRSFDATSSPMFGASSTPSTSGSRISITPTANNQGEGVSDSAHTSSGALIKLNFPERVQELLPELGGDHRNPGLLFDFEPGLPLQQTLCIAAYLSSNNLLSESQTVDLMRSVTEHGYENELKSLLRLETWTTRVFGLKLVEAAARMEDINLLRQMHMAGATFNHAAELIMRLDNAEILDLVIPTLDPNLLKGASGGKLLRSVVTTSQVKVAEALIQSGAEVNMGFPTTPLWEAARHSNLAMVELLIRAGADVNRKNATLGERSHWPLGAAALRKDINIFKCLINHGARFELSRVGNMSLVEYTEIYAPAIHRILLSNKPHQKEQVGVKEIVSAAESGSNILNTFVNQHRDVDNFELQLEKALIHALEKDETKAATSLLQYGVDPDTPRLRDTSAFVTVMCSGSENKYQLVKLLLGYKANVNDRNWVSLLLSEECYDSRLVRLLVEAGFDLERYGPEGLEAAAESKDLECLALLLELGSPLDEFGKRATALQTAAWYGNTEMVRLLVDRGAALDKEAYPLRGFTAMQGAAMSGNVALVKWVHGLGAALNDEPARVQGVTSLEAAVRPWEDSNEPERNETEPGVGWEIYDDHIDDVVTYLLDEGANVNREDGAPRPLLHDFIERGNTHLLRRVVEAGAKVEHKWGTVSSNYYLRTPLQLAAEVNEIEAVKILLDHGAEINAAAATERGRTALQAAAVSEDANLAMVELLLQRGADVNARPAANGGVTALQAAAIRGHINIAMRLIEEKADVNARPAPIDGRTAVEGAAEHGRLDMVRMLLNAGAVADDGFQKAIKLARDNRHFVIAEYLERRSNGNSQ